MHTRRYETVFILPADMEDAQTQEILQRLYSVLERSGGILVKREDWGVRKLAYVVNRNAKGRYFLLDFVGSPKIVSEVERHIKMIESIIRFLTVKKEDEVDMDAIRKEQQDELEKEEARKASALERAALAEAEKTGLASPEKPQVGPSEEVPGEDQAQEAVATEEDAEEDEENPAG